MSYETEIAGVKLANPIFNASGPDCTTLEELNKIGTSGVGAIMTKSCTLKPREGNPEPRYADLPLGSINSMGLPNLGYQAYIEMLPKLKKHGKPLVVSVSGLCLSDNIEMIRAINDSEADLIELNLSCPNVVGKPQVGYDFEQSEEVLKRVMKMARKPIGVKLPPYFDFAHFTQMAALLNKYKVAFITCVNSIGNALFIDPEKEEVMIRPKAGFGGLGGKYVKPTALANVHKFHELLDPRINIIGVGGIYTGTDVFEFILAGAKAVQIGTFFKQEGPDVFSRLEKEFNEIMQKKGYASIEEVRGKLKSK